MQSRFDIIEALYQLIFIPEITGAIDGKIYMGEPPSDSGKIDVGLNIINNPNKYLQNGFCNVNIYVPKTDKNRDQLAKFKELVNIVLPLLEDASLTKNGNTFHFQIDDDKGIIDDNSRDNFSYYNIKLEFQTFKKI